MLGKRPRPMIGKLSELLVSGSKPGFLDLATSPRGPLDLKSPSPRGLKRFDVGGVGLGIVAALEKSSDSCRHAICSSNLNRSKAIVVSSGRNWDGLRGRCEDLEMESLENYTYVTSHGPGKSSTKVYYDGGERRRSSSGHDRNGFGAVKETTPAARFVEGDVVPTYPTSDFLSTCHLCRKKLHGKDIYMYRGEKAFCSTECRSTQIMMDERKEQCRSEASRSAKVPSSPYNTGQIFSTGILAI
ncbi:Zf-FLZ domain - like 10 [Theobroma cacao]|uniref:FLZ-type domain-containing protein n=1 Tax=Theobroma cacao TaxID=3641 RepID=A0A061GLE8_THECC|nr:Uncharacterized protein TCM_037491 [Theobroma cacao]WRX32734.1 Zf-FLZ domain - like 10 [Theobroma cacao]